MIRIITLLIANLFVVDYGVIPDGKDSSVYVIQIEPEMAGELVEGYVIESSIPPELQGIRKFRIQIGNEELTKPTPLIVVPKGDDVEAPEIPNGLEVPNESLDGKTKDVDLDAFPLLTDPALNEETETLPIIPDESDTTELPGVPVILDSDIQSVYEGFEPDETLLLQLSHDPVEVDDSAVVIEPEFDNVDSGVVTQTSEDIEHSGNPEFDLRDNGDTNDRIILEELPDSETASDEDIVSLGVLDAEPELLRNNKAEFVRLANMTSSDADVSNQISNVGPNKPLQTESRSWPLFSITLLGLLVSIGGNVYLGLTVLDFYRKRSDASTGVPKPKDAISQ